MDTRLLFRLREVPDLDASCLSLRGPFLSLLEDDLWASASDEGTRDRLLRLLAHRVGLQVGVSAPGWHRRNQLRLLTAGPELAKGNYVPFGLKSRLYNADGTKAEPRVGGTGYPEWGTEDPIVSGSLDLLYTLAPQRQFWAG